MNSETTKNYISGLLTNVVINIIRNSRNNTITAGTFPVEIPGYTVDYQTNFGDYSSNIALILSNKLGKKPKDIAIEIMKEIKNLDVRNILDSDNIEEKNGFINFTLSVKYLFINLKKILSEGPMYGCSLHGGGRKIVVEYFQNNVAKPPHVGHLRSAVIGDCLLRVLKSQGYKTISDTHIGDWGVQFGILIFAYKEFIKNGGSKEQIEKDPINELNKLYVGMSAKIEADESLREKGKEEFVKLEKGNRENRMLWQWFVDESLQDFEKYRKLLNLLPFDHNLGESFYEDKMPAVLEGLKSKALLTQGETGEQYVDLEEHGLGRAILVKSDEGTTYLLRDFAAYIFRKGEFDFYKNIYVVDNRQSHHFRQLFKSLELLGYETLKESAHVDFGFMSLPEGAISTRRGTTVSLQNLLSEAKQRAVSIIQEKNPGLENKEAVAEQVALAAIKYFDLSHNRKTEIVFTWEKALSFEGNTGPYLQYTHARICGILRKLAVSNQQSAKQLDTNQHNLIQKELFVLRKLVKYPEILAQVAEDFYPNNLCNYLFELSQNFNQFYEECPVFSEPDEVKRNFRIALCQGVAQILENGLYLLGIDAPEEM